MHDMIMLAVWGTSMSIWVFVDVFKVSSLSYVVCVRCERH